MDKMKKILPLLLAVVMVLGGCLTAHAEDTSSVTVSDITFPSDMYDYWILGYSDGTYYLHTSHCPMVCSAVGSQYFYGNVYTHAYIQYSSTDLENWTVTSSAGSMSSGIYLRFDILLTNYDIYYRNTDEIFFQVPVVPPVPLVTVAEELPVMVTSQTKVIVIIAVGCLALLTSSLLLPKVLHKFL